MTESWILRIAMLASSLSIERAIAAKISVYLSCDKPQQAHSVGHSGCSSFSVQHNILSLPGQTRTDEAAGV